MKLSSAPTEQIRNPDLEAAIVARPDDPAPRLVYGDWLSANGSPHGELIAVQHALSSISPRDGSKLEALYVRERELLKELGLEPKDEWWAFRFHTGFVDELIVDGSGKLAATHGGVYSLRDRIGADLSSRELVGLRALRVRWHCVDHYGRQLSGEHSVPGLVARIATSPVARHLREVELVDWSTVNSPREHGFRSRAGFGGDLSAVSSFRELTHLTISGVAYELAPIALPRLRVLSVTTSQDAVLRNLAAGRFERLERLRLELLPSSRLWSGEPAHRTAVCTWPSLRAVLDARRLPALRHLELSGFAEEVCLEFPTMPLLRQLEVLSIGPMTPSSVRRVLEQSARFTHLRRFTMTGLGRVPASLATQLQAMMVEIESL